MYALGNLLSKELVLKVNKTSLLTHVIPNP